MFHYGTSINNGQMKLKINFIMCYVVKILAHLKNFNFHFKMFDFQTGEPIEMGHFDIKFQFF